MDSPRILLLRTVSSAQGTFGFFCHPDLLLRTCELPWHDNEPNFSCIPEGLYVVKPYHSRKFGDVWHVTGVDGRTWILTHSGNVAGDVKQGWHTHSEGCILLGKYMGFLTYNGRRQRAVMVSKPALRALHNLGLEQYLLEVKNGY